MTRSREKILADLDMVSLDLHRLSSHVLRLIEELGFKPLKRPADHQEQGRDE